MMERILPRRMHSLVQESGDLMMNAPRRLFLASRGALCMTREEAEQLLARGENLLEQLVDRGQQLESEDRQERERWLKHWERRGREQIHGAEEQLEQQVKTVLKALHIPSARDVARLDQEVERLSAKLDAAMLDAELKALPISGYQEMTVKEILPLLEDLDEDALRLIEAFEKAHSNRVTILRDIENKLAADA